MAEFTGAYIEQMLDHPRVRNFRASFQVELPDGKLQAVELTMPAGELRFETGHEPPAATFVPTGHIMAMLGRYMMLLSLLPDPSLDVEKQAAVRVVP
jgi:hypothetical protein